ncbi:uncharacterized protein METZ01_LOCUS452711 [marine metagenome]|uniref:Uncharacterized protein n=1 Tax=marine metagenome TaxID=408172 RepID=A0A382ZWG7_9ZZZZ
MTEDTKQFVIKVLVAGVVIVALYFLFSPYRICTRAFPDPSSAAAMAGCIEQTSW